MTPGWAVTTNKIDFNTVSNKVGKIYKFTKKDFTTDYFFLSDMVTWTWAWTVKIEPHFLIVGNFCFQVFNS